MTLLNKKQRQGILRFIIAFVERRHEGDYITVCKKSRSHNIALHCCSGTTKCQFHFFLNKNQQVLIWGQHDTSCITDSSFSTAIHIRWTTKKWGLHFWYSKTFSLPLECPGRLSDLSVGPRNVADWSPTPTSAEINHAWSYASILPCALTA
jgi:hypothetical protein